MLVICRIGQENGTKGDQASMQEKDIEHRDQEERGQKRFFCHSPAKVNWRWLMDSSTGSAYLPLPRSALSA